MTETPLDRAHAAMVNAPEDDGPRLRFYERLIDAELVLLLSGEAMEAAIEPRIFPLESGPTALAFDRDDRLAAFVDGEVAHAELSGRTLVPLLAEGGLGLGLNLGVASSSFLMEPDAIAWLANMLRLRPMQSSDRPVAVESPTGLSEAFLLALDDKLPAFADLAEDAFLATATYKDGTARPLLAFARARAGAEGALARAVGEVLAFSGEHEGTLEVAFLDPSDAVLARFERVALRLRLPETEREADLSSPGTDPDRPPKLF